MHVYSEKDPIEINVEGQFTISCMWMKPMKVVKEFILED